MKGLVGTILADVHFGCYKQSTLLQAILRLTVFYVQVAIARSGHRRSRDRQDVLQSYAKAKGLPIPPPYILSALKPEISR